MDQSRTASIVSLFTSGATLLCCALPALLIALGAGATLSTLFAAVPQFNGFAEHTGKVLFLAAFMLAIGGWLQWRARNAPCPADPVLAAVCIHARRNSLAVYAVSVTIFLIGAAFALPALCG